LAKQTGLGDNFDVHGYDLSGDIGAVDTVTGSVALLDLTGIDKSAVERFQGLRSGEIAFSSWYNDAANQSHDRLSTLPTTDIIVTYWRGNTSGDQAASIVAKQVTYDLSRSADGGLAATTQALSTGFPLEWGRQVTSGKRTDSSATAPTSGVDYTTVSTAFGASCYVQLLAFTGTSVTFELRDAATEPTYSDVTGGASDAMSAIGAQRWATSATETIRRFINIETTGTFSNAVFRVAVTRHLTASL
jgi:hypothetical protein